MINDLDRLRAEYAEREQRFKDTDIYSVFNPSNLFMVQQRQRETLRLLRQEGYSRLEQKRILEMGCGCGGILTEFLAFGATPQNLFGVDLLRARLFQPQQRLPGSHFSNADGQALPFASGLFDLVMQYTALSSLLDFDLRQKICQDMLRVLKPSGLILWYDFWLNPTNPQTHGIRPAEIKRLFPHCHYEFRRTTLAPPITRKLAHISWGLCLFLEGLKIFNTHYLVAIRPLTDR
jgi:ubiquinone/menaquinone biosynthesis C-methylase UbiE